MPGRPAAGMSQGAETLRARPLVVCAVLGAVAGAFAGVLARAGQDRNGTLHGLAVGGSIYWAILLSIGMALIGLATAPRRGSNQAVVTAIALAIFGALVGKLAGGELAWRSSWRWSWSTGAALGTIWGAIVGAVIEFTRRRQTRPASHAEEHEPEAAGKRP